MTIDFTFTKRQLELRDMIRSFAQNIIRPQSLVWDRAHGIPEDFLSRFTQMASAAGGPAGAWGVQGLGASSEKKSDASPEKKKSGAMVGTVLAAEELSCGDAALLLCLPGPGLGGP